MCFNVYICKYEPMRVSAGFLVWDIAWGWIWGYTFEKFWSDGVFLLLAVYVGL